MITGHQIIKIGEVRCSIGFEDGFFQEEFSSVLSAYKRWGFCSEGKPEINIVVRNGSIPTPSTIKNNIFYHSMKYDSIDTTLLFNAERFEGCIGFSIKQVELLTPMRIWELLETFICNAYLFYFLINKIGIFIHGCGVADGENGYVFAGSSGSGKSTMARLSLPRTVLCDELVLLRTDEKGNRRVYGTPFFGDLDSVNKGVNCKAIYFIEKSDANAIVPVTRMKGIVELMKEGVTGNFMSIDGIQSIYPYFKLLRLLGDLLDNLLCFNLKFKKNNSFWEVISGQ